MTRTTELLKGCKECMLFKNTQIPICNYHQGLMKGRLDALKEEVKWLIDFKMKLRPKDDKWFELRIEARLASIQEEIKLIEEKI